MFESWQAPDRDSPQVHPELNFQVSEALQCLLEMEGADGHSEEAIEAVTGKRVSRPRRWHKMFERMGLLFRDETETKLTPLGMQLRDLKHGVSLRKLANQAIQTLSRYQLKNPVDDPSGEYPEETDINPYWAVWKAILDLDGRLHWDELNRELMRVLKRDQLDAAIEHIRSARADTNYDPVRGGGDNIRLADRCFDREDASEGRSLDGQIRDQITTPWLKRVGFGELLLISPGREGGGYWSIRPDYRDLLTDCIERGAPAWQPIQDKHQWFDYLSAGIDDLAIETEPITRLADQFHRCTEDNDLRFIRDLGVRAVASLCSKRFLILTGLAGSGKTKLAQAFAQWITPKPAEGETNPHIALIPVGADWMGNENILGYPNGLEAESYVSTPALNLILHAEASEEIPHFLILDEMNLSHVERYFADFLSAIESGEAIPFYQGEQRKDGDLEIPTDLKLPKNLFVIGTVNVDETTYMFSPKVLDRANVIEFRMEKGDLTNFLATPAKPNLDALAGEGEGFGSAFVEAAAGHDSVVPSCVKKTFDEEMTKFFEELATEGAEFGYRTAYESGRFFHFYNELRKKTEGEDENAWFDQAFDAVIVQKFLPKLHGSSSKLSELLNKLWVLCQHDEGRESAISPENAKAARFPMSAAKIARMIKVLERNGFVSFAEA